MLTYTQFRALSTSFQEAYAINYGNFLIRRTTGAYIVDLYYLQGFYCELWQQRPAAGVVVYLHTFETQSQLYPYLKLISLPESLYAWIGGN